MPKRSRFSKEEEELMKNLVLSAKGKTGGKVYWQKIKDSGIFERHSAESLKFHWKLMSKRETSSKTPKQSPANKKSTEHQQEDEENQENQILEVINTQLEFTCEKTKKFEVSVYCGIKEELFPITTLGEKAINKLFHKLFLICCKAAGVEIDQEVVLMVLDEHDGKVSETISYFQSMKSA
jgi:hypothetical protein